MSIVDQAFEGIDRAIANTKKNLANARELFESYLNAIFIQKGNGWVEKKLGDTELLQIIDGDRGKNYPQNSDFLTEGHCLFLNTKNVRPDGFNFNATMFLTTTLRTISSGDDAVITKGWVVGMGFNQGWLQVQGCNKSVEEMLVERPSLHRCH